MTVIENKRMPTKEEYQRADANGISRQTLKHRIKYSGLAIEEAIAKPLQRGFKQKYKKYIELANRNGISYQTFYSRMNSKSGRKWAPEEAATTPSKMYEKRKGSNYQDPTDEEKKQAESNGVGSKLLYQRLMSGWTMERSITSPVGTSYEGREKNVKLLKLARKNGVSESTFYRRRREGMTPYDAATTPKEGYGVYVAIAINNGIEPKTFYKRVERKMNPMEAATKPLRKRKKIS